MRGAKGYSTYSQNNISVESSEKLILMLYEGALRFTSQAKTAMQNNKIDKKTYWINRTTAIFFELINSLEYSAGDIAYYLQGLYKQQINLLTLANIQNDTKKLDEVLNVLKELIISWKESVLKVQ